VDKAVEAGRSPGPITEIELLELRTMAKDCQPLFREDERRVAAGHGIGRGVYPDCPHYPA